MTDEEVLLRAVCDSSEDDLPRLAYADWCEENGRDERAKFIRIQLRGEKAVIRSRAFRRWFSPWWKKEEGNSFSLSLGRDGVIARPRRGPSGANGPTLPPPLIRIRRGFVQGVRLSCDDFMKHAGALFAAHPITEVQLSDRRCAYHPLHSPEDGNERGGWWSSDMQHIELPHVLPNPLYDLLEGGERYPHYLTGRRRYWPAPEENAYAVLSRACIAYGTALRKREILEQSS